MLSAGATFTSSDVLLDLAVGHPPRDDLALADANGRARSAPSHAATIRVAFPDISAVEPSGFQITTSAQSSPRAITWTMPSASPTSRAHALGVERLLRHEVDVAVRVPALHRQSSYT